MAETLSPHLLIFFKLLASARLRLQADVSSTTPRLNLSVVSVSRAVKTTCRSPFKTSALQNQSSAPLLHLCMYTGWQLWMMQLHHLVGEILYIYNKIMLLKSFV